MDELRSWLAALVGVVVGLVLGLGWSLVITWRLVKLGARMGTEVMRASRLSVHVSREYQDVKGRVERLERAAERAKHLDEQLGGGG